MTWTHRFLGIALSASLLSGCAATSSFVSSQLWPWQQKDTLATDLTKPFPAAPEAEVANAPEFEFSHPLIDQQISRFQSDQHGFYERALARSTSWVPVMGEILERNGVPRDLAYLPLIESGYEPNARSPMGAVGPWQFIHATGIRYGLRIDRLVDERRDPIKSTEAAARYLRDLYDMFNDWHLALAAYNTGEGNVGRILQSKGVEDFWSMVGRGWLAAETEAYVPRFLAALQIAKNPEVYGFDPSESDPVAYDWVRVNRPLPLAKVAELSGVELATVRHLNPALRRGSIPPSGYVVKLPKGSKQVYRQAIKDVDPDMTAWNPRRTGCDPDDGIHCVKRGETYASIAALYNVGVRDLLEANGRRANQRLRTGESLAIPGRRPSDDDEPEQTVQSRPASHTIKAGETLGSIADRYNMNPKELGAINNIRDPKNLKVGQKLSLAAEPVAPKPVAKTAARVHTISKNDTPASIAKRYGVTTDQLLRHNGIRDSRSLKIGQKLKVPGTAKVASSSGSAPVTSARSSKAAPLPGSKGAAPLPSTAKSGKPQVVASAKAKAPSPKSAASRSKVHTVGRGDTPASIAKRYNTTADAVLKANGLRDARGLMPGQKLQIPVSQNGRANVGG